LVFAVAVALFVARPVSAEESEGYFFGLFPLGDKFEVIKLSDKPVPFKGPGLIPDRPELMIEMGDPFLDTGNLGAGFELPGGAVWQPRLWSFLIHRTAVQTFDSGSAAGGISEWSNRLDVYANLQLTGTEKIILGMRPLDENRFGAFSRYRFDGGREGWQGEFNADVRTLFFEGDFGSLFPDLDRDGFLPIDFGFTVGRQLINFQEGIMINDFVDAFGIVRNNLHAPGMSNLRISALYGWDSLDRNDGRAGSSPQFFGLFNSADMENSTVSLDFMYVNDNQDIGDQFNLGFVTTQRIGTLSTAFRVNHSTAIGGGTSRVGDGTLVSAEFSSIVPGSDDLAYFNPFVSIENYTQVGREPINGGPLGSLGILFASPNLGAYGAELNPFTDNVVGFATGYQAFWDHHRRNLILEVAGRHDVSGGNNDDIAVGFQLQQAIGRHFQVQLEGFYSFRRDRDDANGARLELLINY